MAGMTEAVLSVRQVTERIKLLLEQQFPYVWVQGEVTNLTRPASGHIYFSLKDGEALLSCVWFRGRQKAQETIDPLTGEVFEEARPSLAHTMRNGQKLICAGQVSVYPSRGGYQLYVDVAQDSGEGLLYQALEELKQALRAEGLFEPSRKRPLPAHPVRIAVITSPTGAAIQDFIRVASTRGVGAEIRIYPALVQGDEAPAQIIQALQRAASEPWADGNSADVLVLLRGGGSLQDLWAFNDAELARTLFSVPIPVLTGIGHEIDTSIADLVADVRAATPSHAAQLLWQDRDWYAQRLDELELSVIRSFERILRHNTAQARTIEQALGWFSPKRQLDRIDERTTDLTARLLYQRTAALSRGENALTRLDERLFDCAQRFPQDTSQTFERLLWRFNAAGQQAIDTARLAHERTEAQLVRFDPLAPLERGYALVRDKTGAVARSVESFKQGDHAEITLKDGSLSTTVQAVRQDMPHLP